MKSFLRITLTIAFSFCLFACTETTTTTQTDEPNEPQKGTIVNGKKNGLFVTNKKGKIANKITYKDGVRHGLTQDFFLTGELRNSIMYDNGMKTGEATFYYIDGSPYRVNTYVNDKRQGIQYKYHKNGEVLSKLEYHDDHPGTGLIEYSKSGRAKKLSLKILTKEIRSNGKKVLQTQLSNESQKVDFFIGELTDGKFFNNQLHSINIGKGYGQIDLSKYKGQDINIIARYQTRYNNDFITSIVYHVK